MNIYVETIFVLELVFQQEQHTSCEQILDLWVVSASLRGGAPIVLGVIARHNEMEDGETGELIRESANLVGFRAELAEEAFEQIG